MGVCFFSSYLLCMIICVRHLTENCERVSMILWIFGVGILRSMGCPVVEVSIIPRMLAIIITGGRTCHPCWVNNGWSIAIKRWWSKGEFPSRPLAQ